MNPVAKWILIANMLFGRLEGFTLLVLFTPGLKSLFMVAPAFGFANLGEIVLLAFLPTLVIQLVKLVCDARRGK